MDVAEQKKNFYAGIYPSRPNEWEVDEIFESLAGLDAVSREALLSHVGAIWPVSHSLCLSYLSDGVEALSVLPAKLLPEWVRQILGLYEQRGLLGAREFMGNVDKFFLGPLRGEVGVNLDEIMSTMIHYVRGISGRSFEFGAASLPMTDTRTIYLPETLDIFTEKKQNMLLYKLLVTIQWGHVESGIFRIIDRSAETAADFLSSFPDRRLAIDIFAILQTERAFNLIKYRLPGLYRRSRELCRHLLSEITAGDGAEQRADVLRVLLGEALLAADERRNRLPLDFSRVDEPAGCSFQLSSDYRRLVELYENVSSYSGSHRLGGAALLLGKFDFQLSGEVIQLRRRESRDKFIALLAPFMEMENLTTDEKRGAGKGVEEVRENILMVLKHHQDHGRHQGKNELTIDNDGLRIPEELSEVISEITDDLGHVPDAYVQAAAGIGAGGMNLRESEPDDETRAASALSPFTYDEWDYRRSGYRANWCTLYEKELRPVRSNFVAATLEKYHPQLVRLRRQFEMLRTCHRFVRRRRQGDDIDLDALIDALGDSRAGLPPSDRLFIRLLRDERDITAMFLVDMSNSTQGWVGVAVKEALLLLVEALDVVGDLYGIYGFSGMRRSKSEIFRIKGLQEPYGPEIQGRIAAVKPMEYTRMGTPIRHLTQKLLATQSRVKLLVVISDGKPEDYDDYKGQYAIEDTRKALLEARGSGIYPFCITIDKAAHDYLLHMFGHGNYVFVDDVSSLPPRMVEMYRLLTS